MKLIDATAIGLLSQSLLIYNELKQATELNWTELNWTELNWSQGSYPLSPSVTLCLPQWKNPLPNLLSDLESACLLPFKFLGDLKKFYFFCFFTGELQCRSQALWSWWLWTSYQVLWTSFKRIFQWRHGVQSPVWGASEIWGIWIPRVQSWSLWSHCR